MQYRNYETMFLTIKAELARIFVKKDLFQLMYCKYVFLSVLGNGTQSILIIEACNSSECLLRNSSVPK